VFASTLAFKANNTNRMSSVLYLALFCAGFLSIAHKLYWT